MSRAAITESGVSMTGEVAFKSTAMDLRDTITAAPKMIAASA